MVNKLSGHTLRNCRYFRRQGLRAGNKLHERHVQWQQQKMKVKLAVQDLSSSVANALEFCRTTLDLPQFQGCEETVKFIRTVDRLFDLLNSRNPIARGYKAPMRMSNAAVCHGDHSLRRLRR